MSEPLTVVCLGDSLTYGFPYGPRYSWVQLVAKNSGLKMINKGVNGDTTTDMWLRLERDVLRYKPRATVIMGGTNDVAIGEPVFIICQQIEGMVKLLQEHNITPVLGLPIPSCMVFLEEPLTKYRQWLKEFSQSQNIMLLDFYSAMINPETGLVILEYYLDDVHPSRAGYEAMGRAVLPDFLKLQEQLSGYL
ncbi:MAG: GDSL family lipase [Clostridia bacterium]|nr:GDSL family lipase [Clostridia bacterium]